MAQRAVDLFREQGFPEETISLSEEQEGSKTFALERHSHAADGAILGATLGAAAAALVVMLAINGSPLQLPGLEEVLAADPVVSVLAAIGAGGIACGIVGAIIGLLIPRYEAKRYSRFRRGGVLLSVYCSNRVRAERAESILKATGASEVSSASDYFALPFAGRNTLRS
jgi:hypothetical protein